MGILVLDFQAFQAPSFAQVLAFFFAQWFGLVSMELMLKGVQPADLQRAVEYIEVAIMTGPQTQRLSTEDFTDKETLVLPVEIAFSGYAAHENARVIFDFRHAPRKGS